MAELRREKEITESLKEKFGNDLLEFKIQRARRIFATITPSALRDLIEFAKEKFGMSHISTITGVDLGKEIGVYYHLMGKKDGELSEVVLSIKAVTLKTEARLPSITSIIPGATLYEREVHDMFGVVFEGHPDLSPLILPDGWPPNLYPLRKECSVDFIKTELGKTQGANK